MTSDDPASDLSSSDSDHSSIASTTSSELSSRDISTSKDDDSHTVLTSNLTEYSSDDDHGSIGLSINSLNPIPETALPSHDLIDNDDPYQDPTTDRALIDTGAFASCTNQRQLLHDYVEFTAKRPCPIKLQPATKGSDAIPKGFGFLHVPCSSSPGFLAVKTFYHPALRTTVIDDRDLRKAAGKRKKDFPSSSLHMHHEKGFFTMQCCHRLRRRQDVYIPGILIDGKCYTDELIHPDLHADDPHASASTSSSYAFENDPDFKEEVERATLFHIFAWQETEYTRLRQELESLPPSVHKFPFHEYIHRNTPVCNIRATTQRLLWHQRLGHPSDYYLYNAHKHIKGIPKFPHMADILDQCPTCIRAKQTKEPAGPNSTRTATEPYQGLSIDFSFSGTKSQDPSRTDDYVGLHGETCWLLITDHFTRYQHGITRISKATPIHWLRRFLTDHSPRCPNKYVFMDQGGELYRNPAVVALFQQYGYTIRPTGADSSNQNGPVERAHLTVANAVRSFLIGANLPAKFWPYAFHHYLRIKNSMPSRDQTAAPLKLATGRTDDFSDRSLVLPVLHAFQGHPEAGKLWEAHVSGILSTMGFTTTTHDRSIYTGHFNGEQVLLLRQVDDFALACSSETIAKQIFDDIGARLKFDSETSVPFKYFGLITDFNGVDVSQYSDSITISAKSYISRVLHTHGWSTPNVVPTRKPTSPLPDDAISSMFSHTGPSEDSTEHQELITKYGFRFRSLLGELLYAYVTCRPDIGYALVTLSKFASCPHDVHFAMLKHVARYLRETMDWGITYHKSSSNDSLPPNPVSPLDPDVTLPPFPPFDDPFSMICLVDAAHGNDMRSRRSTTGYAFLLCGGAIAYRCTTQSITATSSTEAEFMAAVTAAKQARYLRFILAELGFPQLHPTPIYEDNMSAIKMINARIPTERSRHIDIQYFAIQDWKEAGDIVMKHIPGIINAADDLTKPLGWILHHRHARRILGHYSAIFSSLDRPAPHANQGRVSAEHVQPALMGQSSALVESKRSSRNMG